MLLQLYLDAPVAIDGGEARRDAGRGSLSPEMFDMPKERLYGGLRVAAKNELGQAVRLQRCAVQVKPDDRR